MDAVNTKKRAYGKDRRKLIALRLTEEEKIGLEERAAELGLSLSDYIREKLIHIKDVTGKVERPPDD